MVWKVWIGKWETQAKAAKHQTKPPIVGKAVTHEHQGESQETDAAKGGIVTSSSTGCEHFWTFGRCGHSYPTPRDRPSFDPERLEPDVLALGCNWASVCTIEARI